MCYGFFQFHPVFQRGVRSDSGNSSLTPSSSIFNSTPSSTGDRGVHGYLIFDFINNFQFHPASKAGTAETQRKLLNTGVIFQFHPVCDGVCNIGWTRYSSCPATIFQFHPVHDGDCDDRIVAVRAIYWQRLARFNSTPYLTGNATTLWLL